MPNFGVSYLGENLVLIKLDRILKSGSIILITSGYSYITGFIEC
jgi:hypothetical protein